MIEHIVLFRFSEGTSAAALESIATGLRSLASNVPGIVSLSFGKNFSERGQGYDYGLVVRFADRKALDVYQEHPAHQKLVVEEIRPALGRILAIDYEF